MIDQAQELKIQQEKARKDIENANKRLTSCLSCLNETSPRNRCTCIGGGGGSGGGSEEDLGKDTAKSSGNKPGNADSPQVTETQAMGYHPVSNDSVDRTFNSEIISDLLSKKLLSIDNDNELGILTIKLLCDPKLLSVEQKQELKKYADIILKELKLFEKEKNISANCESKNDDKGDFASLRIALPTLALYKEFIKKLDKYDLLPIQNVEQKKGEKVSYDNGANHFRNPFKTKPTPSARKNDESAEAVKSPWVRPELKPK